VRDPVKILLLHSEDNPLSGRWAQQAWDRVVDLGIAGPGTYRGWSDFLHCPVAPLPRLELADIERVKQTLFSGLDRMVDARGLDWWELLSIEYHERAERILSLGKVAEQIGAGDEVFASRGGFDARVMELLLGRAVPSLLPSSSVMGRVRRMAGVAAKLGFGQMRQILGDKYDADYGVRRWTSGSAQSCERPVVLLPTAYVNASRTGLGYAAALPDRDFLLVTTRQSGWVEDAPKNVKAVWLAAYAPGKCQKDEYEFLLERWRKLRLEFVERRELFILSELGAFACVPGMLEDGLGVRDAWVQVLEREPVNAVLCADDSNTYTRLPLLLARERGLAAIACHHGALDGRYLIKRNGADVILAKGRMEKDYLVNSCGVAEGEVEIAAPPRTEFSGWRGRKGAVVFFSEPYEVAGGRGIEFYREVLPRLAEVAAASQSELVIKLHPQESRRERQGFVNAVLTREQRKSVRVVEGKLSEDLLREIWFAVTVVSTTAVECTLRGIPVFLCRWLDWTNYGYAEQFIKFGAGATLRCADEISGIPGRVEDFLPGNTRELWETVAPERLEQLLSAREPAAVAAAV
jgi:hypothetical protein